MRIFTRFGPLAPELKLTNMSTATLLCPFKFQSRAVSQSTIAKGYVSQAGHKPNGKIVKIDISGKKLDIAMKDEP